MVDLISGKYGKNSDVKLWLFYVWFKIEWDIFIFII